MKYCFCFLLFLSLCNCKSIEPVAPLETVNPVPKLVQPNSFIVVPIKLNLAPYLKEVNTSIPKKFEGQKESCEGVSFAYTFYRNPIQFNGKKNTMDFNIEGKYSLKLNYCPQCTDLFNKNGNCIIPRVYVSCGINEPLRKIQIDYKTEIKINPDFQLKSNTELKNVEISDPCEISVFKYDASKTLKEEITKALNDLEKDIDKEIGKVDIKFEANKAWKLLTEPIAIGNYGFLYANPNSIDIQELTFNSTYANIELALGLKPILTSNLQSNTTPKKELPKLSKVTDNKGFNLALDIYAQYDSLSKIITTEIKGTEIEIKKKRVVFNSFKIYGADQNKLNFEIEFSGSKNGHLYLNGTPTFDKNTQTISFPDLEFDLKTKSALLKSAKWLFSEKITNELRKSTIFNVENSLVTIKKSLNKEINRGFEPSLLLKGSIDKIEIESIYPSFNELILRINSSGQVSLEL